jgi:GntR family transcriptional regulator
MPPTDVSGPVLATEPVGRSAGDRAPRQVRRGVAATRGNAHTLDTEWNEDQPIYRQLRDRVVAMILDGLLAEGDPLPSVRQVAADHRVNPLTVLKAYQQLADEALVETRRGRGMFVRPQARERLLAAERARFLQEQWPRIRATMARLGLRLEELLTAEPAQTELARTELLRADLPPVESLPAEPTGPPPAERMAAEPAHAAPPSAPLPPLPPSSPAAAGATTPLFPPPPSREEA